MALNSILDTVRSGLGQATRLGRDAANQGLAVGKKVANRNPKPKQDMDDVTLARKVESEIFRPAGAPKGKVDVNAVDGVVWLRGEVKNQKQSTEIEAKTRAIPEVKDVENLLHLPKTPAPSRTRGGAKKTPTKKAATKRFDRTKSSEKPKSSKAEPLPAQAATTRTGRKPAPLGTKDPEAPAETTSDQVTGGTTPTPTTGNGGGAGTGSTS
jgi:hypothetical protein